MINIFNIKRAVKYGQLEFFVQKGSIYVNDCQSGDCIQVGTVHGDYIEKEDEDGVNSRLYGTDRKTDGRDRRRDNS